MSGVSLSDAFPIDRTQMPVTEPRDILKLGRALIREEGVSAILGRVGNHLVLPEGSERNHVYSALIRVGDDYRKPGHQWDNMNIAIVLGRRFVTGAIDPEDSVAAERFVEERIRRHLNANNRHRPDLRMKLSEMIEIMESLRPNYPDLMAICDKIRQAEDKKPFRLSGNKKYKNFGLRIDTSLEYNALWIYGYANRHLRDIGHMAAHFVQHAFFNNPPELTPDAMVEKLRSPFSMKRYHSIGNDNFDADLPRYIDDWKTSEEAKP